ncbi:MAG: DUF2817 domain-containing protein [Rhodospirillales bacterium]|nr:DUF2817 domain-containing protein [Rhodospirillales bacterium]
MGKPYENNRLFSDSYVEARTKFRDAAQYVHPTAHDVLTLPGFSDPDGDPLTTDISWHGPQNARGVLILSSGLHGIEGYAGSAIQTAILSTSIPKDLPKDIALVTVHALNPYGFAYGRRVNEDNIDLNRNFIDWSKAPPPDHPLTAEINDLMLPEEKWKFPFLSIAGLYLKHKPKELQKLYSKDSTAVLTGCFTAATKPHGQTEFGITCWTGSRCPQIILSISIFTAALARMAKARSLLPPRRIPRWGSAQSRGGATPLNLLPTEPPFPPWFTATLSRALTLRPKTKTVTQMTLEFGTYAKLDVLHALAMDNWVYVNGMTAGAAFEEARSRMKEAFAPHRDDWRQKVITQGTHAVNAALTGLQNSLQ